MSHFDRKEFRFEMHIKRSMARLALEHRQGTLLMSSHVTTMSGASPAVVGESSRITRRWLHGTAVDRAPFFYLVALPFGPSAGLAAASLNNQELESLSQETTKTTFVTENHLFASPHAVNNVLVVPTNESVGLISHRLQISPTEKCDVQMRVYWVTPEAGTVLSENRAYVPPDVIVFFPLDYTLTCSTTTPAVPTYAVRRVGVVLGEDVTFSRFNERVANRRKAPTLMHVLFDMSRAEAEIFFRDINRLVDKRKDADARVIARAVRDLGRARIRAGSLRGTADVFDETIAKKLSSARAKRRRSHSSGFISTKHGDDDDDKDEFDDMVTGLQEDSE